MFWIFSRVMETIHGLVILIQRLSKFSVFPRNGLWMVVTKQLQRVASFSPASWQNINIVVL